MCGNKQFSLFIAAFTGLKLILIQNLTLNFFGTSCGAACQDAFSFETNIFKLHRVLMYLLIMSLCPAKYLLAFTIIGFLNGSNIIFIGSTFAGLVFISLLQNISKSCPSVFFSAGNSSGDNQESSASIKRNFLFFFFALSPKHIWKSVLCAPSSAIKPVTWIRESSKMADNVVAESELLLIMSAISAVSISPSCLLHAASRINLLLQPIDFKTGLPFIAELMRCFKTF